MKGDKLFRKCVIGLLILVIATYSNHFGNSFHFDDSHCINDNTYIRSLKNIPEFFKSAKTFSSLPQNQTYRPMLTTLYTIDYATGGFYSFFYHLPVFIFFLLQGFCMYLLIIKVFDLSSNNPNNKYFALFTVGWYMLATANADTINYISSSSDSISTFWVIAAMVVYIYRPKWRKFLLYLVPVIIGALFKQSAVVFPALLAAYVFLFEKQEEGMGKRILNAILVVLPSFILSVGLYELQAKLTSSTYVSGGDFYNYIISQPFVILHYFVTFFFPFGLSADSDWLPLTSIASSKFLIGVAFIIGLVITAAMLLRFPKYFPMIFGIAWFFIALIPSTVVPLAEVMNDHRAFFPYVGLVMASGWGIYLVWEKLRNKYAKPFKVILVAILMLNAVGTFARNFVWWNEETLWHDVTIKSPGNGRGMMNYGLALMSKGDFTNAELYFKKSLTAMPNYAYVYENMAILKAAQKQYDTAETYFKQALQLGSGVPAIYYYYAKYLHDRNRNDEAVPLLKQAIQLSAADVNSRYLLMQIYLEQEDWHDLNTLANETLALLPDDATTKTYLANSIRKKTKIEQQLDLIKTNPTPESYLALSLLYYNHKDFDKCIAACNEALKIKPDYYLAYYNMGTAYDQEGDWQKAEDAFDRTLKINPHYIAAKNNYFYVARQIAITDSMVLAVDQKPTPEGYLNLSLMYYRQNLFLKSVEACKEAIKLNPSFALAYNNMCAAYNNIGLWDSAINAGRRAVELDPNSQLAKNNFAQAIQGKATGKKD